MECYIEEFSKMDVFKYRAFSKNLKIDVFISNILKKNIHLSLKKAKKFEIINQAF